MRIIEVKKILPMILTAVLITGTLTGCGEAPNESNIVSSESVDTTTQKGSRESDPSLAQSESAVNAEDMFSKRDLATEIGEITASAVLAQDGAAVNGQGMTWSENDRELIINEEGIYEISGKLTDGRILVNAPEDAKVQLVLAGVTIENPTSACICVKQADKVFVTLKKGTTNVLTGSDTYADSDDPDVDAVIYSKCDLTVNGTGSLIAKAVNGHGIFTKKDLKIASANMNISAGKHGLAGKNSVRIASGDLVITSVKDGIHSEPKTDDNGESDPDKGYIYIAGGNLDITAQDDGISAEHLLQVDGGNILIRNSYEGLEGTNIIINNGTIELKASDDGLNAAGGSGGFGNFGGGGFGDFGGRGQWEKDNKQDNSSTGTRIDVAARSEATVPSSILITGGVITINAEGDGIDSNGTLTITGGEITVSGPTGRGNSAIDYETTGLITGGKIIALGSSDMAMNFGSDSTQGSILVNTQTMNAGTEVILKDAKGNVLLSLTATKTFSSVVVSCPELVKGETYTLTIGDQTTEITLEDLIYGSGGGFGGGPGGMGGHGGMGGFEGEHGNRGDRGDFPEGFEGQFPEGFGGKGDRPEGFEGKGPGKR